MGRGPDGRQSASTVGADEVVQLTAGPDAASAALAAVAADVDIVIGYLWGEPAQQTIVALLSARSDRSQRARDRAHGRCAGS